LRTERDAVGPCRGLWKKALQKKKKKVRRGITTNMGGEIEPTLFTKMHGRCNRRGDLRATERRRIPGTRLRGGSYANFFYCYAEMPDQQKSDRGPNDRKRKIKKKNSRRDATGRMIHLRAQPGP